MQQHPFISSVPGYIRAVVLVVGIVLLQFGLLIQYSAFPWEAALADSLVYVGLFAGYGFLLWYITSYIKAVHVQVVLAVCIQALCLTGSYVVVSAGFAGQTGSFVATIPFRILFGWLGWLALAQWYRIKQFEHELLEAARVAEEQPGPPQASPAEGTAIDRIPVKDGPRIHIVSIQDLLYIQACGDYVTLFTSSGQYVKEQTMKYFAEHLPGEQFIRIHRSTIVNTGQIARIELFGKETYQIRLNNGSCLKASIAGYKLLKERLDL